MTRTITSRCTPWMVGLCIAGSVAGTPHEAHASPPVIQGIPVKCIRQADMYPEKVFFYLCQGGVRKDGSSTYFSTPPAGYALVITDVMARPNVPAGTKSDIVPWTLSLMAVPNGDHKKPADVKKSTDSFSLNGRSRYATWLRPNGAVLIVPPDKFLVGTGTNELSNTKDDVETLLLGVLVDASLLELPYSLEPTANKKPRAPAVPPPVTAAEKP